MLDTEKMNDETSPPHMNLWIGVACLISKCQWKVARGKVKHFAHIQARAEGKAVEQSGKRDDAKCAFVAKKTVLVLRRDGEDRACADSVASKGISWDLRLNRGEGAGGVE